ncbi:autophagy-related protein 2 homolog B isoform X2 [Periplaneta americana]|uniref:autophagy-related protein 2 homolog B isoform X2 n=1 Tax=Periplaneta americana TaxID=6978 RepID=UPI0037E97109
MFHTFKMPWYLGLPWSESIKKRACRYLLQRYLGQFLEEKLTLDQLTVDLYNGTGTVTEVRLDVQALNELGEQQNLPIEFVDGYISQMSVSIPWSSLLSDSSFVEVTGLILTIQPKQRADNGVSMFESMWSSMTSSMQLAEECLKQGASDGKDADQSQPLEGLELFAQAIDSILSRVKVKFVDTVIRLEHVPKDSNSGVAVEFRIKVVDYCDEAGTDPPNAPSGESYLQPGSKVYQVAAFTTKKFYLEGVTMYTDEFPSRARTFSRSVMSLSSSSTPDSKNSDSNFGTAPVTPASQSPSTSHIASFQESVLNEKTSHRSNLSLEPDPILFGKLAGRQEVRLKLKQSEGVLGPKVDLEVILGSLTTFLSARQLHVLVELLHGLATPDLEDTSNVAPRSRCVEKPMDSSDFHRVEQELQQQLHPLSVVRTKGLQYSQGWSTASLDDSDEEFLPMQGAGMSESVLSDTTSMEGSVSSTISSSSSTSKSGSVATSPLNRFSGSNLTGLPIAQNSSFHQNIQNRVRKKSQKENGASAADSDPTAEVSHFHIRLSSLAIVLLHDDILTLCVESDGSSLARSSVQQMKTISRDFFEELGHFAVTGYGNKDFNMAKDVYVNACQLNHIRLLAAPVIMEGNEKKTSHASSVSGTMTSASLEVLECLVDKKTPSQTASVEYVELLKFQRSAKSEDDMHSGYPLSSQADLKLHFKYSEKSVRHGQTKHYSHPRTDISIALQPCCSEIDVSIVDRITALLNPQPLCRRNINKFASGHMRDNQQSCFYQAVENPSLSDSKMDIKVACSLLTVKLRFPTPDLRPIHDMDRPPWWRRAVRKDFLTFELSDVSFHTLFESREPCKRFEIQCRDITGLFQEAETEVLVPFVNASADDKNGNSLPDGGEGFGWPRIVIQVYPASSQGDLDETGEVECDDKIPQTSIETLESSGHKDPSPFSSKKVIHESDTPHGKTSNQTTQEGEELMIPGDKQEMAEFIDYASRNSRIQLEINLPCASMQLTSKHLYELIYNRINTDMFLWEPAAPKPKTVSSADLYCSRGQAGVDLASTLLQDSPYPTAFSMCKSGIQYESDSDSEDTDGVYYSVYEHRQRHKRKQQLEGSNQQGQSTMTVTLTVNQGVVSLYAPVRDSGGNVIPGQHGELQVMFDEGNMFSVSGYKGKAGLGYVCLQVNQASFYHNGLVATSYETPNLKLVGTPPPSHLEPTIYRSDSGVMVGTAVQVGSGSNSSLDMLAVAIKIQVDDSLHNLKTFRVAAGLRGATLRHRMCISSHSWFTQLVDFFDVIDYPVAGYEPPGVITELHMHLWDCAVDYRPLHLPLKSMITVGSFSISSNIAAQTSTSTLRFIAEDAALFISDKTGPRHLTTSIDLRKDYVCVLDLGLFELSLRLSDKAGDQNKGSPRVDLRASNNVLHIRTCADSGKALTDLLTYFASDGDLMDESENSESSVFNESAKVDQVLVNMGTVDNNQNNAHNLSKSQVEHVHDMMEEAMRDTHGISTNGKSRSVRSSQNKQGVEVFFFPDENHPLPAKPLNDSELCQDEDDDNWEDDFCILDKEAGSGILTQNGPPEVRTLTHEPVRIVDNHFSVPIGKTDQLRAPEHFPDAVLRYTLCEMTVIWHMYGGYDFDSNAIQDKTQHPKKQVKIEDNYRTGCSCPSSPPFMTYHFARSPSDTHIGSSGFVTYSKSSPSEVRFRSQSSSLNSPKIIPRSTHLTWQARGGSGRQHDVLMELQLNKVKFRHEVYPDNAKEASRQILLVSEVEVRDRLASSQFNKFLYQFCSETRPKQSHANMIRIVAVHVRPDPKLVVQECCLKVTLLPLRLNIDQDSLLFLFNFFSDISGLKKNEEHGTIQCNTPRHNTPTHQAPVMTVNVGGGSRTPSPEPQRLLILLEEDASNLSPGHRHSLSITQRLNDKPPTPPIFFRSFLFSRDVPIRLDYQGKRVDMSHGPLTGILLGLGELNSSEFKLKRISYRHGLLGFDKLVTFVLNEWLQDIKKNQIPSLLGGVGPINALVKLVQGIRDLFWLPIEQYQKDGRIVRGLQRGANSFTTSTAMAALELTNRLVQAIQSTAEMAYDMVSPGPSVRRRIPGPKGRRRRYNQPADIREGMANAYMLVKEGIGETAQTIMRVASEEHEQKGMSGAVGGVLRQIPPTVVKPIILATEATSNVLGGMRSQLVPDARREAVEKWRNED